VLALAFVFILAYLPEIAEAEKVPRKNFSEISL
jgi:hypothetical protein